MRHALSLMLLLSASSLAVARDNQAAQARDRQEIRALLARMATAEAAGDASAIAICYESDGMLLPSSGQPVKGREDITRRYQAIFAGKTPRLPLESEELWVLDDWAVSRGATRAASARKNVKGAVKNRYVMTLKRHGDAWEIHSLVWNPGTAVASRD
jgi:uncharacterized protein (TIGR02246 family)